MRGVLLENKGVVDTMGLAISGADLDIMRKAGLRESVCAIAKCCVQTYAHGGVKRASNAVILLQSRTATEDLGQPELANGVFHVCDSALGWLGCLDPLRRFAADTTHHVRVSQSLGCTLGRPRLAYARRGGLRDPRMER